MRLRRPKLGHVLFLALLLSGIIPLVVSNALLVRQTRTQLEEQERNDLTAAADALTREVDQISRAILEFRSLGETILLATAPRPPLEALAEPWLERVLQGRLSGSESIEALQVLDLSAVGRRVGPAGLPPEIDQRRTDAFHDALARRGPAYRYVSLGAGAVPAASVAVPVYLEDRAVVVEGLVRLPVVEELSDFAVGSELFLLDEKGATLWSKGRGGAPVENADLAVLAGAPGGMTTEYDLPRAGGGSQKMLAQVLPVADTGWRFVLHKPKAEAFAALDRMVANAIAATALLVALALGAGATAARWLSRPIQRVAETSHQIAEGNFGGHVDVPATLPRELAELAEDFNRMSGHVQDYVERLRQAAQANRDLFIGSIRAFAAAIDAKDPYTRGHSERVAALSRAISRHLSLPEDFQQRVWIGALLHDVGKIGVEDRILRKDSALTAEEFEQMKSHTVIGAEILISIEPLREMVPAVRWHHEAWNGRGYPDAKKGEEIPLIARIVAVADTFDAITTNRPYQAAFDLEQAIGTVKRLAGSRFDAKVVTAFLRAHEGGEIRLPDPGPAPERLAPGPDRQPVGALT
jgi:putative nucleotidyltransferase with HDIG domain